MHTGSRPWAREDLSPGCRSVGLCRALSELCRGSVGALSGLCRLTIVGPLSDLCRPLSASVGSILTGDMCDTCRPLSVCRDSVGLSVCRSVGLCRSLSEVCRNLSGVCRVSVECLSSICRVRVVHSYRSRHRAIVISVVKSLISWGFPLVYSTSTAHFLGQAKDLQE